MNLNLSPAVNLHFNFGAEDAAETRRLPEVIAFPSVLSPILPKQKKKREADVRC